MAVRQTATSNGGNGRAWFVAACLVVLFIAALFLRAYWNLDAANPEEGKFVLSGGSDPYYHKRAIDAIQAGTSEGPFRTLVNDPLLNYPLGSVNPNPPLFEWSVAVAGHLMGSFFDGGVAEATWWATLWAPAIYGALTLIPIYFIGKSLFDRRVGLVAALLWTLSTSAIDATGVGLADHDATVMFFASLAFLFYIKTIQHFRGDGNWVTNWRDGGALSSGFGRMFSERRGGFAYALLTGLSIMAVALTWKGFPYVIGIIFIYAILQMVVDHWRNRDSTGIFFATLLAMVAGTLLAYPYYAEAGVGNFLRPVWFIIGGFILTGLVLVPTRDLPTILVMPAAALVAVVAAVVAFFVMPEVARSLLYATVYFKQTRLYETIAEAHPADFSTMMFGIGPVPFFLAIAGWVMLAFTIRRHPTRAILFGLVWGAVALYMAQSAVRFLFNAIPVFCVFAAYMTIWVLDWMDFGAIRKSLAANRGNSWQGFRKGVRPLHVVGALLVVLLFVAPNVMLAADAALPPEAESRIATESESDFVKGFMEKRMGAYGQGFIPGYWTDGLTWLDQHDANITDPADRPAFLSWWDYGHWAIAVGKHPAVADNFQNGYEFAANFILSQNETQAVQLLAARLSVLEDSNAQAALGEVGSTDAAGDLRKLQNWEYVESLDLNQSVQLVSKLEQNTGKKIRYFAADVRMFPYDNPQTPSIEQSSIYYAPVKLKGEDPDQYVATKIDLGTTDPVTRSQFVNQTRYEQMARDPIRQVSALGERFEYQPAFFNSMYWRAYVGTPVQAQGTGPILGDQVIQAVNQPRPGFAMQHFRLVYSSDALKILEYYPGAVVEGTVTEEGQPLSGVEVVAYDDAGRILVEGIDPSFRDQVSAEDFNIPHSSAPTAADGSFRIVAPFAMEGGNVTLVVVRDGVELARTQLDITREDANTGRVFSGVSITLQRGNVEGVVFEDADGNGQYDAANETTVADAVVTIGGQNATSGADGRYRIEGVSSGTQDVTVTADRWTVVAASSQVRVLPGETATHDVGVQEKPATVSGTLYADQDGDGARGENEGVAGQTITFRADDSVADNTAVTAATTSADGGSYTVSLRPGSYVVTATWTNVVDSVEYTVEETLVVGTGDVETLDLRLARAPEA